MWHLSDSTRHESAKKTKSLGQALLICAWLIMASSTAPAESAGGLHLVLALLPCYETPGSVPTRLASRAVGGFHLVHELGPL